MVHQNNFSFTAIVIVREAKSASNSMVFFSHNKSANNTFNYDLLPKRVILANSSSKQL
jgi:hypothetical protein